MLCSLFSALLMWFGWVDYLVREKGKARFCTLWGVRSVTAVLPAGKVCGEGSEAFVRTLGMDAPQPASGCSQFTVSARQFWGADLAFHHHRENRSSRPCLKSDAVRWDEADSFLSANSHEPNVNQLLKTKIMLSPPWFRNDSQSRATPHHPNILCLCRVSLIYFIP